MSSSAMRTPLVRHIASRGFAAEACTKPVGSNEKIVSAKLPNNTFVASVDNGNPITRVAVAFRAGSRYEPQSELGITHVVRSSVGLTTPTASNFIIRRQLAQLGASLSATGDREFITYTLEVGKDNVRDAVKLLTASLSQQEFRPWELDDNKDRLTQDIITLLPQVRAVDLMHRAAYRRTLGNSLFISPRRIGKLSTESLQHYVASTLTPERCAVTVVGDNQDRAVAIAQSIQLGSGKGNDVASAYHGGDARKEMGGELTHVAIAVEGAKAGSNEALALAVAARALGNGPVTKWGADNSVLAKTVGNVGPFAAAGFNLAYLDSGLFGVVLSVPKDEAAAAIKAVAKLLKSGSLPAEAIKAGKAQLKMQILNEQEEGTNLAEQICLQGLISGTAKSTRELAEAVENLSAADIGKAVSAAAKSKLSMGSAGNLLTVPYVDEL